MKLTIKTWCEHIERGGKFSDGSLLWLWKRNNFGPYAVPEEWLMCPVCGTKRPTTKPKPVK